MIRLLLLIGLVIIVGQAFWRLVDGVVEGATGRAPSRGGAAPGRASGGGGTIPQRSVQMVRDPACGTFVVPARAIVLADGPNRLYFCSDSCRDTYLTQQTHQAHRARPA